MGMKELYAELLTACPTVRWKLLELVIKHEIIYVMKLGMEKFKSLPCRLKILRVASLLVCRFRFSSNCVGRNLLTVDLYA